MRNPKYLFSMRLIASIFLATSLPIAAQASIPAPSFAAAVGYKVNTFQSSFWHASVDLDNTGNSGFAWYPWNFFGQHAATSSLILGGNGSIILEGDSTGSAAELATATPSSGTGKFTGTAFGGGGYFEITLRFNPNDVVNTSFVGWPAVWMMSAEHMATGQDQWVGQANGYEHFIEADIMEYDIHPSWVGDGSNDAIYGGNIHDWSGYYKKTCLPGSFCDNPLHYSSVVKVLDPTTDLSQFHKYGLLWVPATAKTGGYAQYYFDGQPIGSQIQWTQYTNQAPPTNKANTKTYTWTTTPSWQFGVMDKQHLVIALKTGVNQDMTVESLNIWQTNATSNITH